MPNLMRRSTDQEVELSFKPIQVNEGIALRLIQTPVGEPFVMRSGTNELPFDEINAITWGEVITRLQQIGVLEADDDRDHLRISEGMETLKRVVSSPRGAMRALSQLLNS